MNGDRVEGLGDVVESDVKCLREDFCVAWDSSGGDLREIGFGAAVHDVEGAGYVEHLVGDHEDAEVEGRHCDR